MNDDHVFRLVLLVSLRLLGVAGMAGLLVFVIDPPLDGLVVGAVAGCGLGQD